MSQPISVVMPVYDGVTQLDFTGPHQFLSRTPDLDVRVASLGGGRSRRTASPSRTWRTWPRSSRATCCWCPAAAAASLPSRMTSFSKRSPGLERPRAI